MIHAILMSLCLAATPAASSSKPTGDTPSLHTAPSAQRVQELKTTIAKRKAARLRRRHASARRDAMASFLAQSSTAFSGPMSGTGQGTSDFASMLAGQVYSQAMSSLGQSLSAISSFPSTGGVSGVT